MFTRASGGALGAVLGLLLAFVTGCGGDDEIGETSTDSGGSAGTAGTAGSAGESGGGEGGGGSDYVELDVAVCDPSAGGFTLEIDNEYFPLWVGTELVLEGLEQDAGETLEIRVEITVLDETEEVAGVTTRVVEAQEFEDDELVELVHDFYAQAEDGTVCYFGEDVDEYEDGEVVGHGGQWRAGENGARPGIIMPGDPTPGTAFMQERAPGVGEDMSAIASLGQSISVPAGDFDDALHALDWNPLDGDSIDDAEDKYYVPGIGIAIDAAAELTSYTLPE